MNSQISEDIECESGEVENSTPDDRQRLTLTNSAQVAIIRCWPYDNTVVSPRRACAGCPAWAGTPIETFSEVVISQAVPIKISICD